jgi:hypothetical protein
MATNNIATKVTDAVNGAVNGAKGTVSIGVYSSVLGGRSSGIE